MKRNLKAVLNLCLLLAGTLTLTGCPPLEEVARDVLWTAKGFLEEAAHNHPECNPDLPVTDPLTVRYGPREQNPTCRSLDNTAAIYTRARLLRGSYCSFAPDDLPEKLCQPTEETKRLFKDELKQAVRDLNRAIGRRTP